MTTTKGFSVWLFFTLFICLGSCKKSQDSAANPPATTDTAQAVITEKGIPFGDIVTAIIGAEGGTITAADGGATLVVPRGAIATNTAISIQAVTNTLPQGLGDHAYQFLPEGLVFTIAARLTLQYDTTENNGVSSAGLVIANQEADGSWMHDAEVTADENRFTITADMEHFSTWTIARAVVIQANKKTVELGGEVSFSVTVMEKYIPVAKAGTKRKKAIIKMQNIASWLEESADDYSVYGWRVNYNDAPGLPKDGVLTPITTRLKYFAAYTAPSGLPPVRNPVSIQVVIGKNINTPNIIASAVVFVRKNGYLKATIGGQVFNYVQHIGEPSTNAVAGASTYPELGGTKLIVTAFNSTTGSSAGFLIFPQKGTFKIVYKRDVEFVGASTSSTKSWQQEYYTRNNGNGTTRCKEFGPKYSELMCTLTEYTGGIEDWVAGTITGTLYDDTDANRRACQNSDAKSIKIEFVLKAGF
jgi:hypothetical protein